MQQFFLLLKEARSLISTRGFTLQHIWGQITKIVLASEFKKLSIKGKFNSSNINWAICFLLADIKWPRYKDGPRCMLTGRDFSWKALWIWFWFWRCYISIQMVLFELFNGKHVYRSWYHTSKLLTNLELSSNIYPPNKKSHIAKELPISLTLETQKGRTWRKIFPWTLWKIIKTNTFDSTLTGLNWNSQFKSNSVKPTSITVF